MSFGLLNSLMLFGLAAVALPVLVHLISRRKFDIVHWGAMQFLELGRRTRRRIRIEELLLMLLRMGLLALVAFALCRPWGQGGAFTSLSGGTNRDVVLVIDGSYSMGWEGKAVTPHAAAGRWVRGLLEQLRSGDTVSLLDARDQVRAVIETPTSDLTAVRAEMDALPAPAGTSRLAAAAAEAVKILSRTSHAKRDVEILTDGQALPWSAADETAWLRLDDLLQQPAARPQIWVVDMTGGGSEDRDNFAVDRLQLSRELSVPDFPIRIRTSVRQSAGVTTRRRVSLEVNGQRLEEKTLFVNIPPGGKTPVEFEHRFPAIGSYVVSVVLDADNLPGDNRSDAAVIVTEGVPVLLVDGDPHLDPARSETFFVRSALSASGNRAPWVVARVVNAENVTSTDLEGPVVVFLCNVPRIAPDFLGALQDFVARGGGLVIAPGDQIDTADYNGAVFASGAGLLPLTFGAVQSEETQVLRPVTVSSDSLELPWLSRFRAEQGVDFVSSRFAKWWRMEMLHVTLDAGAGAAAAPAEPAAPTSPPQVQARLKTSDPLIVAREYGAGSVIQLAVPLDADWCTLPSKNDFVPFLHELVFLLASRTAGRNVDVGMPLQLALGGDAEEGGDWTFHGPDGAETVAVEAGDALRRVAELPRTGLPGVYRALRSGSGEAEYFVANSDRAESDLAVLDALDKTQLAGEGRMEFVSTVDEYQTATLADASRTELWWLLLLAVLGLLVFEVVMTRRLVQGGHEAVEGSTTGGLDQP
jgi:hypothetical protein